MFWLRNMKIIFSYALISAEPGLRVVPQKTMLVTDLQFLPSAAMSTNICLVGNYCIFFVWFRKFVTVDTAHFSVGF